MDVLAEAQAIEAAGTRVIHMEVGEPAHGAPRAAREALAAHERAGPEGRSEGQTAVPDDIQAARLARTITGDLVC